MAGTLLTARSTFLARAQAMQLLYAACTPTRASTSASAGSAALLGMQLPPPAVWKPQQLWTGKQARA